MSRQAGDALHSLSTRCQRKVTEDDYEIIVVEQPSADELGPARATAHGRNIRYFQRKRRGRHPIANIDFAYRQSRAPVIGVMAVASIATPRLMEHVLIAQRLVKQPLIVVPAYELGLAEHGAADDSDLVALLEGIDWRRNAYDLYDVARFSNANPRGYLCSVLEAELFFCSRTMYRKVRGGAQARSIGTSDDLYAKIATLPKSKLIVLGGEACFREPSRAPAVDPNRDLWQRTDRQPLLLGAIPGQGREFLRASIGYAAIHEAVCRDLGHPEWPLDGRRVARSTRPDRGASRPRLSVVVVVYRMARQAENTVYSLSTRHQWNIREEDYEIIVVENESSSMLGKERVCKLGNNVRYFAREDRGVSPAAALNFGISVARAPVVGLMIDGARMVTPRVLEHVLTALQMHERTLVVVPGYHLGPERQHITSRDGYDEAAEQKLLAGVDWRQSGYRVFEIASFDDTTLNGYLNPLLESTCLFCPKACLEEIGGIDERFNLPGGGVVNLDLFERLCRLHQTKLVMLWGEGAFHQYHGGVSSTSDEDRETKLETFRNQYQSLRGRPYSTWEREPLLLGTCAGVAHQLLMKAAWLGRVRYWMIRAAGRVEWPHD